MMWKQTEGTPKLRPEETVGQAVEAASTNAQMRQTLGNWETNILGKEVEKVNWVQIPQGFTSHFKEFQICGVG